MIRVICLGNPLMRDDGAGQRVYKLLSAQLPDHVDLVDGGTGGLDLILLFDGPELVVIVDTIMSDQPPGTITILEGASLSGDSPIFSMHQIRFEHVLSLARRVLDRMPRIIIVGIEAADISYGIGLTDEVESGAKTATDTVIKLVRNGLE